MEAVLNYIFNYLLQDAIARIRQGNPVTIITLQEMLEPVLRNMTDRFAAITEQSIRNAFFEHSFEDIRTDLSTASYMISDYLLTRVTPRPDLDIQYLHNANLSVTQAYSRLKIQIDAVLSAQLPAKFKYEISVANAEARSHEVAKRLKKVSILSDALQQVVKLYLLILAVRTSVNPALARSYSNMTDEFITYGTRLRDMYLCLQSRRVSKIAFGYFSPVFENEPSFPITCYYDTNAHSIAGFYKYPYGDQKHWKGALTFHFPESRKKFPVEVKTTGRYYLNLGNQSHIVINALTPHCLSAMNDWLTEKERSSGSVVPRLNESIGLWGTVRERMNAVQAAAPRVAEFGLFAVDVRPDENHRPAPEIRHI